ncbi:Toll-like receptor 6 [Armadillidium nasatum]|uniref:Toll-like receptor 6 n=1 Tax=Armadillidium nasatum TaxID=96803 RepID=A0A5N5T7F6_9CRUS|nr:Toll-like receptor 6 [Armadillidium nasatum]
MNQISKLNPKSISPKWITEKQKEAVLYLGDSNHRLPVIGDVSDVVCTLPHSIGNLTTYKKIDETIPDNFLCPYATHCFTLCHCCEFIACDCQMKCPNSCSCFHDDTWSINLVDCSRGSLTKLPDKIPMDATIVYLDGNDLQILHAHHFIGRHSVQKLFLNSSNIQNLHNRTFHGLSSLKYLYLQDNLIVQLSGFEFSGLDHLKELHLQNNRISFVSNQTFEKLTSLEVLRIDNNFIVNFPVWIFSKNVFLRKVALANNPWDCSCVFIASLRQWMSYTKIIIVNQNDLFCMIDGSKIMWSSAIEPNFSCFEGTKDVAHYQFGQRQVPFLAGGLCGGIILVTALILVSLFFARRKAVAAHKLGYSPSSIRQEEDGKVFDAYISYSVKDSNFARDVLAPKLENDNEWKTPSFRNSHVENIKNKENNLIVINLDGVQDCLLEYSLKSIVKKANILKWEEKNFWKRLNDYLPMKSMYSGFSLYISDPLYKSPIPLLSSPRNVELPSSSSVLTSTTGLTTPSDAGRSSLLHDPQATFKNNFSPRNSNINSCDYVSNTARDIHIPSCHCQRIPQSIYSSIEGDTTSVHTYNSLEILSQQMSSDRHPSPDNHQYTIANKPLSPTTRSTSRKKCNSSPGSYDNVILSHEAYHRTSCRRRLGTAEEMEGYESSSSASIEKDEDLTEQDYGGRPHNSPVLPGFPTDECFV